MGNVVLFILSSRLLLYSAGVRVNSVRVVLSGLSVRLLCFVHAKFLCRYVCLGATLSSTSLKHTLYGCAVYVWCVDFSSLDVYSSFLISMYTFIVSKALLISSATVIEFGRSLL